jgi:Fe-S oxidoreductase
MENAAPPAFSPQTEFCYFPCCTQAYDARNTKVGRAVLGVLKAAGINYGVLAQGENCCGDAVRKAGGEDPFLNLAQNNMSLFREHKVKKIVVSSPHCLNSFREDYAELGDRFEVSHLSEVLYAALQTGKLQLKKTITAKAIYHDPCYLGRHQNIYDAPRELLSAVPGIELLEFHRNREDAVCCGGGGGRLWMETPVEERFAVMKLREALELGAEMLVTACPYCVSMFEDAKVALDQENFRVAEISEILLEACEESGR